MFFRQPIIHLWIVKFISNTNRNHSPLLNYQCLVILIQEFYGVNRKVVNKSSKLKT